MKLFPFFEPKFKKSSQVERHKFSKAVPKAIETFLIFVRAKKNDGKHRYC